MQPFHLGVLGYLFEVSDDSAPSTPLLKTVELVIGVSGGAITAAHFALNFQKYCQAFPHIGQSLPAFVTTIDARRQLLTARQSVSASLSSLFDNSVALTDIPPDICLCLLGTSYRTGGCISFSRDGIAHYATDHSSRTLFCTRKIDRGQVRLSDAVAASAAFPPFFPPITIEPNIFLAGVRNEELLDLFGHDVGDGGIRDNLGIEFYAATQQGDGSVCCIISDAGRLFDWDNRAFLVQSFTAWQDRLERVVDIQGKRIADLDLACLAKPPLQAAQRISLADTSGAPDHQGGTQPYLQSLALAIANKISDTPTDLSIVNASEAYALVRLGYDIAARRLAHLGLRRHPDRLHDFWKTLCPSHLLADSKDASSFERSLLAEIRGKATPRFDDTADFVRHIPVRPWIIPCALIALRAWRRRGWIAAAAILAIAFVAYGIGPSPIVNAVIRAALSQVATESVTAVVTSESDDNEYEIEVTGLSVLRTPNRTTRRR